jgi:hypothetical protein
MGRAVTVRIEPGDGTPPVWLQWPRGIPAVSDLARLCDPKSTRLRHAVRAVLGILAMLDRGGRPKGASPSRASVIAKIEPWWNEAMIWQAAKEAGLRRGPLRTAERSRSHANQRFVQRLRQEAQTLRNSDTKPTA